MEHRRAATGSVKNQRKEPSYSPLPVLSPSGPFFGLENARYPPRRKCFPFYYTSVTYLITFTCYGTHLHGDESGFVDKLHNVPGMRLADPDPSRLRAAIGRMTQAPYGLDACKREIVLTSIGEVCSFKSWDLLAAHVRSNHVHVVVSSTEKPDKVMNAFKA
jgi:hypothetical protein